jgi:antitoxin ParD1/3/4
MVLDITKYHLLLSAGTTMATSYSIGKHFEDMIQSLIESGRYSTASEILRDGLRLIEEREDRRTAKLEALRAEIQKGFDGGPAEDVDIHEMIESVKARGRQQLAARKRGE